ncbi:hypothetical protein BDW22DRAFT_1353585 [Trametopsis cervina]|nr:hypothetical protein BDW22DRAFT_1353585 [Trametopsis cervina]
MSADEPVRLLFDPSLKVAGQRIEGAVEVYWPGVIEKKIEELVVKLRGTILTSVQSTVSYDGRTQNPTETQEITLIQEDVTVWHRGGAAPASDTPLVRFPFAFVLPPNLPPSCDLGSSAKKGRVGYYVEAVGKRPGLHFNKHALAPFAVLPALDEGAQLADALRAGWQGPWSAVEQEKEIRRGLWGEHAHVKIILALPTVAIFPVFAPIPFSLTVTTLSKHMHRDDTPSDGEPIFPAPPLKPSELEFKLERDMHVKARAWAASSEGAFVQYLGGLGPDLPLTEYERVRVQRAENVWVPSEKDKGAWRQEATIRSFFELTCPPSFDSSTMSVNYQLRLKVDFPGIGNDLKIDVPIRVSSSFHSPGHSGWQLSPPPQMELPPEYFQAANWTKD